MPSTTTSLTSSPDPSVFGESVFVTATVTPDEPGATPTGTVTFDIPGEGTQVVTLDAAGQAGVSTNQLPVGVHTITAAYSGDATYDPSSGTDTQTVGEASTTLSLSIVPSASVFGDSVTFTADVDPVAPGEGTPTGDVVFSIPGLPDESVPLDATGEASFTTSAVGAGTHTVTATYGGDAGFAGSTDVGTLQVDEAATTTELTVGPDPAVCGQTVTLTATVTSTAGTPTGTVTFQVGADVPDVTVTLDAGGQASADFADLHVGTYQATAFYNGEDPDFAGSSSPLVPVTVNQAASTTTVTVSPNPAVCGQEVMVCASVAAVAPGAGSPTGTVTFTMPNGATLTGTPDPVTGEVCVMTDQIEVGTHTVTAVYNGDECLAPSSGTAEVTVSQAASTTTVSVSPNPAVCGETVMLCASVAAVAPGAGMPTGTVTFTVPNGPTLTGTPDPVTGEVCVTTDGIEVGTHTVTAAYGGDECLAPSSGTAEVTVSQAASATTVSVSPNPVVCGQEVMLCASVAAVAPGAGTPTGTVTFTVPNGPTLTGTPDPVTGEVCVTTDGIEVGTHTVTAAYGGDECLAPSSGTAEVTVSQAASTTTVTVSPNPAVCGQEVMLCASVAAVAPGAGTPTGTVTFTVPNGPTLTGTPDPVTGEVCVTTDEIEVGAHTVTATYSGDGCLAGSTGTTVLVVAPGTTSTSLTISSNPAVCGQPVTLCATVTAVPAECTPTGTVVFFVAGGPTLTGTLDANGEVCVTVDSLSTGIHLVTACYEGSTELIGSCSPPQILTVNQAATTTSLSISPDTAVCGQPVTLCATVTPTDPNGETPAGTVVFAVPGGPVLSGTLDADGQVCVTTTHVEVGTHTVTATYGGDACFSGSSATGTLTVAQAETTTTVTATPNPSNQGEKVTFTAQVTPVAPGAGILTGTVTFTTPGGLSLTADVNAQGRAKANTSALPGGTHVVTATYSGNACFMGSSGTVTQVVNTGAGTELTAEPATIRLRTNGTLFIPRLRATLVTEETDTPLPGMAVTFTATPVTGPVTLGTAVTDANGVATLTNVNVAGTLITTNQYRAIFAGASGLSPAADTAPLLFRPLPLV
ncbi:Ig-like domain repeat protein [Streptomyces phyllanthi]|uniref:Ig-like domain repeat protein n=1 Tax=Streptomyces phyllanthi TaxID=1803180 RepID=A0A5N8WAA7_9ACTN|nr:Ig-like domain-containing protein [Streptomyces phyllanthi]MPY44433.1 Ig-like domain repeat protein [Streptomyces phyllanthi]